MIASILFWYLGLLPDLATMRDRALTRGRQLFYGVLALGFRGSGQQWRHYHATYAVLAAIMAPLVCSVHSIVGLDFAGAATVGWHSTEFPPFFVFGAFLSGFATVLILIIPLRRLLRLDRYITGRHLDVLCRLMLTSSLFRTLCLRHGRIHRVLRRAAGRADRVHRTCLWLLRRHLLVHHRFERDGAAAPVVPPLRLNQPVVLLI